MKMDAYKFITQLYHLFYYSQWQGLKLFNHNETMHFYSNMAFRILLFTLLTINLICFGAAVIVTIPCSASVATQFSLRQGTNLKCALHKSSWWPSSPALDSNSFILCIKPFNYLWFFPWILRQSISLPRSVSQINGYANRQFVEWRS